MNLYEITNGACGCSYVRCYVVAENEDRALEIGFKQYKEKEKERAMGKWTGLYATLVFEDLSKEHASEVSDEGVETE